MLNNNADAVNLARDAHIELLGDVKGANVIIVDDFVGMFIIST